MSQQKKDWLIALGYVALIYTTLEIAGIPLRFLRSHNLLRHSLSILFTLAATIVVWLFSKQQQKDFWRYFLLGSIGLSYALISQTVQTPEEKIHFFEYGLVGIFFFRALSHHISSEWLTYCFAFLIATLAGWIDELLQGFLPHRHYDIRDVLLNAVSACLGLLVFFLCKPIKTDR